MKINVKNARNKLSSLLDLVAEGENVTITRHGKEVAILVPPKQKIKSLPPLSNFRSSIRISGSLSASVKKGREEERY